jgi:hypothetical protein
MLQVFCMRNVWLAVIHPSVLFVTFKKDFGVFIILQREVQMVAVQPMSVMIIYIVVYNDISTTL